VWSREKSSLHSFPSSPPSHSHSPSKNIPGPLKMRTASSPITPPGPWIVPVPPSLAVGAARAALLLAFGACTPTVAAFLPNPPRSPSEEEGGGPPAFLVHLRGRRGEDEGASVHACLLEWKRLYGEDAAQPVFLEGAFRTDLLGTADDDSAPEAASADTPTQQLGGALSSRPVLPTRRLSAAGGRPDRLAAADEPVRTIAAVLAPSALGSALAADLAEELAAACPTCELIDAPSEEYAAAAALASSTADGAAPPPVVIHISALAQCPQVLECDTDPPACGHCVIPASLVTALARHPDVTWVGARDRARPHNGFAKSVLLSSDLPNWASIAAEFGDCSDGTDCSLQDLLPPSVIPALMKSLGSEPPGVGGSPLPQARFSGAGAGASSSERLLSAQRSISRRAQAASLAAAGRGVKAALGANDRTAAGAAAAAHDNSQSSIPPPPFVDPPVPEEATPMQPRSPTCTATCAGTPCGQGFSTCGAYYESGTSPLPLDGRGQLVAVIDSGLDYAEHPFFLDPLLRLLTPDKTPPLAVNMSYRKVVGYWNYMDAIDEPAGHGTHVAGTVAGDPTVTAGGADLAILTPARGVAPGAQIVFTDVNCDSTTCIPTLGIPANGCSSTICGSGFHVPLSYFTLFTTSWTTGARILSNSWGSSVVSPAYTSTSASIDSWVSANPDALVVFAAGNDGETAPFASLNTQAAAKNAISVGAVMDGFQSHMANIRGYSDADGSTILPAYFSGLDERSCTSVLVDYSPYLPNGLCPSTSQLTNAMCYSLAMVSVQNIRPGAYSSFYIDLALCCGCTPLQILRGAPPNGTDSRLDVAKGFWRTYVSRWKTDFSSTGPTLDGRIKPDVVAPGFELISARATGPTRNPYKNFTCASGTYQVSTGSPTCPGGVAVMLTGPDDPNAYAASIPFTTLEPARLSRLDLQVTAADPGYILIKLVGKYERHSYFPAFYEVTSTISSSRTLSFFFNDTELPPGYEGYLGISLTPGMRVNTIGQLSPTTCKVCFGSVLPTIAVTLTMKRGTALSYLFDDSGTSMVRLRGRRRPLQTLPTHNTFHLSTRPNTPPPPFPHVQATPVVSGAATLARQYFTSGFYPGGSANASWSFSPSAALLKGVLINSASAISNVAYSKYFGGTTPLPELRALGGFGVPSLLRGLSFSAVGPATRASGQLPTLLLPGLALQAPNPLRAAPPFPRFSGADPSVSDGNVTVYCIDTAVPPPGALGPGGALPLSITLVWTDPAGSPAASIALVNDLDLEVTPPDSSTTYYGNGDPTASPTGQRPDRLNNVEKLIFSNVSGTLSFGTGNATRRTSPWKVVVRAFAVPFGPQAYSLVVTGSGLLLSNPTGSCAPALPSPSPSPSPAPAPVQSPSPAPSSSGGDNGAASSYIFTPGEEKGVVAGVAVMGLLLVGGLVGVLIARLRRAPGPGGNISIEYKSAQGAFSDVEEASPTFQSASPPSFPVRDYGTTTTSASSKAALKFKKREMEPTAVYGEL
jgi:hypothetical protein